MVVALLVTQIPIMIKSGTGQTTQAHSLPTGCGAGDLEMEVMDRVSKGLVQGGRAQPTLRIQTPSNVSGARVGPCGQGMPYSNNGFKPTQGELEECSSPPTGDSHPSQQ